MKDPQLYNAILNRHSVRQYRQEELSPTTISAIEALPERLHPILPGQAIQFHFLSHLSTVQMLVAQGPYGQFISSHHLVLPYTVQPGIPLVEIGFQTEQFCVHLHAMGLGSCYLGTAGRERGVIRQFDLPEESEMGAAIIYGQPRKEETRNLANYFRKPGYRTRRKPLEDLFFINRFGRRSELPKSMEPIFIAAQRAPSAVNCQPWRFVMTDSFLYLYVQPTVYPIVLSPKSRLTYALHDAGIVMANISMAYQAQEEFRNWMPWSSNPEGYPETPIDMVPVAKIKLEG
ncbi:MAG: hypothetical protein HPY85_14375 [Anaerolineae bacterium]|nr:hypothetical protein [Anaerolineae bacterium]